jgi:hypothetical protein
VFQLTVPLEGEFFGVDFNPAADRLRIVSDLGQNLRHDVNENGMTTIDGPLSCSPPMPAAGITMAAYTNNDLSDQTGTTLFDIDTDLDQVAVRAPANNGSLSATGALGHDVVPAGGFDIYSTLDDDGVTSSVVGLATLKAEGHPRAIHRVNLLTGRASEIGSLKRNTPVVDIAVPLGQGTTGRMGAIASLRALHHHVLYDRLELAAPAAGCCGPRRRGGRGIDRRGGEPGG